MLKVLQFIVAAIIMTTVAIPYVRSGYYSVYALIFLNYPILAACVILLYAILIWPPSLADNLGIPRLFWSDRFLRRMFAGFGVGLFLLEILALCYYFDLHRRNTTESMKAILPYAPGWFTDNWAEEYKRALTCPIPDGKTPGQAYAINNRFVMYTYVAITGFPLLALLLAPAFFPTFKRKGDGQSFAKAAAMFVAWIAGVGAGISLVVVPNLLTIGDHESVAKIAEYRPFSWVVSSLESRIKYLQSHEKGTAEPAVFPETQPREFCISIINTMAQTALYFLVSVIFYRKRDQPASTRRKGLIGWLRYQIGRATGFLTSLLRMLRRRTSWFEWFWGWATPKLQKLALKLSEITSVTPGFAICMLLGFVSASYAFVAYFASYYQLAVYLLVALLLVVFNWNDYKFSLPEMQMYYKRSNGRERLLADIEEFDRLEDEGAEPVAANKKTLLDDREVLEKWRAGFGEESPVPKLVLVAVTGGAIRSATWVAVVLEELGKDYPDRELADGRQDTFDKHVRLFTGASGGMVGVAYYLTALNNDSKTDRLVNEITTDGLLPVASRMVCRDIPSIVYPFDIGYDRGRALEDSWRLFFRQTDEPITFDDLMEREGQGAIPSAIFSPVIVEDGRRLLVSNLSIPHLTQSEGRSLLDKRARTRYGSTLSKSAIEFFKLFPLAKAFRLATAARLNATFPYVSPMLNLPTKPPRRVADAGYYDNFGVDLACGWIETHRDWIRDNTSGLVLIQIRDGLSERDRHELVGPGARRRSKLGALQFLASPLQALLAAWSSTTSYRNDNLIQSHCRWFDENASEGFFRTVVFESPARVAMNWYMTEEEKMELLKGMGEKTTKGRQVSSLAKPEDQEYIQSNIERIDELMQFLA